MTPAPNTRAILLLTAPLISMGRRHKTSPLTPSEFRRLSATLRRMKRLPADLLGPDADALIEVAAVAAAPERIRYLLGRGLALEQALDRWTQRSIWVLGVGEPGYPARLTKRLAANAPSVLYGVGDTSLLGRGGLAVVGSRVIDDAHRRYAEDAGRLAAQADKPLVSGDARGVDQAAMRGAADEGGKVLGVLADRLDRVAVKREYRQPLMDGRMVLVTPFDPAAGFEAAHAMQRNKLIYALADAALVVNANLNRGGTWNGAVEQLDRRRFVPVFVRTSGIASPAHESLIRKGARPWPEPETPDELRALLSKAQRMAHPAQQLSLEIPETGEGEPPLSGPRRSLREIN